MKPRRVLDTAASYAVAAGPLVVLAFAVAGALAIGLWWDTSLWLTFLAIVAEIAAVLLVAAAGTRIADAIQETRQSRRDPRRWRHRRQPQSWRDRRRTVIRLAERGEHRSPGVDRAA